MPSIYGANRYLKGRIFAPLTSAVALADKLVEKGHSVFFYGSRDIQTKAEVISGDWKLTDSDPFYYLFRYRDPQEQKYSTLEIIKRDFEYDLIMQAYDDAVNKKKLDIIHAYHDFGAHYFNELTGFPTIYTLHDPLPQTTDTIEYHRFSKFKHHSYVSISNSQRKGAIDFNFAGTVYHGLNISEYVYGKGEGGYLIHFGRILEDKGTHFAIDVAKQVGIPLHIASSLVRANISQSYYGEKIKPQIDGKRVLEVGFLEEKEKSDYIRNALAFVFPLQWEEPFGLVMIEAMACGTPVIAYNRGSVSEIVRDGLTGFIVDPVDEDRPGKGGWIIQKQGIEGLVEAVKRIDEIDRKACRKHVEDNFTVEKMVEGYEKVYKKILGIV